MSLCQGLGWTLVDLEVPIRESHTKLLVHPCQVASSAGENMIGHWHLSLNLDENKVYFVQPQNSNVAYLWDRGQVYCGENLPITRTASSTSHILQWNQSLTSEILSVHCSLDYIRVSSKPYAYRISYDVYYQVKKREKRTTYTQISRV